MLHTSGERYSHQLVNTLYSSSSTLQCYILLLTMTFTPLLRIPRLYLQSSRALLSIISDTVQLFQCRTQIQTIKSTRGYHACMNYYTFTRSIGRSWLRSLQAWVLREVCLWPKILSYIVVLGSTSGSAIPQSKHPSAGGNGVWARGKRAWCALQAAIANGIITPVNVLCIVEREDFGTGEVIVCRRYETIGNVTYGDG